MKNEFALTLKPEETQVLLKRDLQTVEEMRAFLDEAVEISNQHPSTVYIDIETSLGDFDLRTPRKTQGIECRLEVEGLTDGSVVYNIWLAE